MTERIQNLEHLTATTQTGYSRGGDIFMDQGQNENQNRAGTSVAEPPRPSQLRPVTPLSPEAKTARENHIRETLASADKERIGRLMEELRDDPEFGIRGTEVQKLAGRMPEQEVVRSNREEYHETRGGPRAVNYINVGAFTDLHLQNQADAVNHQIDLYRSDPEFLIPYLQSILQSTNSDETIPLNERKAFATDLVTHIQVARDQQVAKQEEKQRIQQEAADTERAQHQQGRTQRRYAWEEELEKIKALPAGNEDEIKLKVEAYITFIRDDISLQEGQPKELFEQIVQSAYEIGNQPIEYLVQRIISAPLDQEYARYDLSFYARNNLEAFVDVVRSESERAHKENDSPRNDYDRKHRTKQQEQMKAVYNKINVMREAVMHVHEMNRLVITDNLSEFIGVARSITPEQLQVLQGVKGVAPAMRLYDQEIQRIRARDGRINDRNYEEIFGKPVVADKKEVDIIDPITGESTGETANWDLVKREQGTVEKHMRRVNDSLPEKERMAEWELRWALNLGKTFVNNTLRAAEQISLSSNSPEEARTAGSFPQETTVRLMNWVGWLVRRFNVSESRGSQVLLGLMIDSFQARRVEQGYGKTNISKIGGSNLDQFEIAGMFGGSGIWSGWRQELIVLQHAPVSNLDHEPEKDEENIRGYKDLMRKKCVEGFKSELKKKMFGNIPKLTDEQEKRLDVFAKMEIVKKEPEILRKIFLDDNGELKNVFTNALGVILSTGGITPKETDSPEVRKVKEEIRTALWRRVAEDNPLAMQSFLDGMMLGGEGKELIGREEVFDKDFFKNSEVWNGEAEKDAEGKDKKDEEGKTIYRGGGLRDKLVVAHEKRMNAIKSKQNPLSLDRVIGALTGEMRLNDAEIALLTEMRTKGKSVAGDMANVRFAFNPFMNDVIYENIKYGEAGARFYARRTGGDFPGFNTANEEFMKFMVNPGAIPPEKAAEIFLAMVDALGSPMGTDAGQDRILPFIDGYLKYITQGGQYSTDVLQWIMSQSLIDGTLRSFHKPTSLVQQFYGMGAPSHNEEQLLHYCQQLLSMGILRRELKKDGQIVYTDTFEYFKKKKRLGLGWLLAALLRDWGPLVLVGAFAEFGRSVKDTK